MKYGICLLPVIPGRKEPSDSSEIVTQILFGEHFAILEKKEKWSKIKMATDRYECWIDNKQWEEISAETFEKMQRTTPYRVTELFSVIKSGSDSLTLPIGSVLPFFNNGICKINGQEFKFKGKARTHLPLEESIPLLMNSPYLWGGRNPMGIDCSGFSQLVFALKGKLLPRDAWQQAETGNSIDFLEEAQKGDLAFFDNPEGRIIHVGIIWDDQKIIHASGKVRKDILDHYGIYNLDTRSYSHKMRVIKRY